MSKKFIIEVPEGITGCNEDCPFFDVNLDVCDYLCQNGICNQYDFKKLQIEEYEEV